MKCTASSQAYGTAEPRTLPLLTTEGPFLLKLDDLLVTVDGDGDLGPAEAADAQHGMVFQELTVPPFPFSPSAARSER